MIFHPTYQTLGDSHTWKEGNHRAICTVCGTVAWANWEQNHKYDGRRIWYFENAWGQQFTCGEIMMKEVLE